MLAFTVEQWAIVALVFVAGWLLGLASHGGGRKWRERYAAEREAHAETRRAADARTAELERDHARLRAAAPVTAQTVVPVTPARAPIAADTARPAYAAGTRPGWFEFGPRRV